MLKILIITDKKAGHESISKGFVKNLNKKTDIKLETVSVDIRAKFIKKIATIILNNIYIDKKKIPLLMKFFYKNYSIPKETDFDLVVSTGGDTSFYNILISKYLNTPNIYFSSLRGLKNTLFSYVVALSNHNYYNEIVVPFPPVYVEIKEKELQGKYIALLIGGGTKKYNFKDEDFSDMLKAAISLSKKNGYRILLTTSRRTPQEVEKNLKSICEQNKDLIEKAVFFNQKPQKIMNFYLSNADIIFCSEDSGSMITESVLSKKKLYLIRPKEVKRDELYQTFIENILKKGYAYSFEISEIEKVTLKEKFVFLQENPSEIVYNKIKGILNEN